MQIKKTYKDVNPQLLYDEIRDAILKQGVTLGKAKMETYSSPSDSSTYISRGTLTFKPQKSNEEDPECIRAHIVGSGQGETKVIIDTVDKIFPPEKVLALLEELDFIFNTYEIK